MPMPTEDPAIDRALVLGGGGPVGIAWEAGVAAGLEAEGVDLSFADRILGTSAGSFVGAQLGSGRGARALAEAQIALGERDAAEAASGKPSSAERMPKPDLMPLIQIMMRPMAEGETPEARRRELGALALNATTISEAQYLEGFGRAFADLAWPKGFACTAVDAETGTFRLWEEGDGVSLAKAVLSSCSVPGIFPPILIEGRRYIDGGVRTPTNIDQAKGARRVIALAVVGAMGRDYQMGRINDEIAALGPDCGTLLIVPDEASLKAFGPNLMEATHRAQITRAGIEQGRREAERIGALWR